MYEVHFFQKWVQLVGVLGDDGVTLVEMGKHSWGHSPCGSSAQ